MHDTIGRVPVTSKDLETAIERIAANPALADFLGPRPVELITAAENALGGALPLGYKEFVAHYGAGSFGAFEVFGVTTDNFETGSIPNGIWLTRMMRRRRGLPENFVLIADTGDGDYYCLKLGEDGPVYVYRPGEPADHQRWDKAADDFSAFLLRNIESEL